MLCKVCQTDMPIKEVREENNTEVFVYTCSNENCSEFDPSWKAK